MHEKRLKKIGNRLREVRIEKGYTSYENFAFDNDLSNKTVWRLEDGDNAKLTTLFKILDKLDITLEDFFKGIK